MLRFFLSVLSKFDSGDHRFTGHYVFLPVRAPFTPEHCISLVACNKCMKYHVPVFNSGVDSLYRDSLQHDIGYNVVPPVPVHTGYQHPCLALLAREQYP